MVERRMTHENKPHENLIDPRNVEVPLEIRGRWIRFKEKIPFVRREISHEAPCIVIVGTKGEGKSSLNENTATHYVDNEKTPDKTGKILDFFGSRDCEGLGWCRSPFHDSILLVCGDSVDVSSSWNVKHVKDVTLSAFRKYKVILTVSSFFSTKTEEHYFMKTVMDKLWRRMHWENPWYLAIREAANLIYSRITIGEDQARAKAYFIYVLREARHVGLAVGADAIRLKAVDIDLRSVADYTILKGVGVYGLPREIGFLYGMFEEFSVMRMPVQRFVMLTKRGSVGRGWFEYPPWHKTEKEDLLKEFDIQVDYGDVLDYGEKGYKRVSDFEHEEIIMLRATGDKGNSMAFDRLAKLKARSSRTIFTQVDKHNKDIARHGFCQRCKRLKSKWQNITV